MLRQTKDIISHTIIRSLSTRTGGALAGIKVLDLTRILAGPFCTQLLGDLGAEVIKVERPGTGDDTRAWGPPFVAPEMSAFSFHKNKSHLQSVAIDLKKPKGKQLVLELAKECDIFVENYIPGKLTELGVDYESVKRVNPKIIYASITGFGSSGPYAKRAGIDFIANSIGGMLSITGPEDGEPCRPGVAITDLMTALYTKGAILTALFHRERHGKGCKIDANLLSSQVSVLTTVASNYLNCGLKAKRRGTAHESIVPYQAFKCKDSKYVTIGAINEPTFRKLCQLIDLKEAPNDPRFSSNAKRVENRVLLIQMIGNRFLTEPLSHWLQVLEKCGFAYGPINDIDDVFADPQVIHNESVVEMEGKNGDRIKTLGSAVKYESEQQMLGTDFTAPPLLGEHTRQVLQSVLRYTESEIQQLDEQHVIQCLK
ncbi:unnamed protein product [Medioppia subpectinata]|uniref:Uncharacterized protein n=1 Tax=Medioppia subpectinata TaxID=1979941 RepID=A0A7R9KWZ3_9ACAR|nr:unnamed protein product [Medioppia subpectinata]CAG2110277.1 unnamed protein product [Medioppia subpectinata]